MAAVAVAALTADGHDRRIYDVTGPEALSFEAIADAIGQAVGRKVSYVHVPPDYARKQMLADGIPVVAGRRHAASSSPRSARGTEAP